MLGIDHETGAAVGQHDAGLLGADADAEIRIERIDERHRHAVAVDHGEIDRVAAGRRRARQLGALVHVDLARQSLGESLVEQVRHLHAHMRGIGDMRVAHAIGHARRFQHDMETLGAERLERGHVEILQDIEQHQRGEALPVRRQFENVEAAIIGRDRRDDFAAVAGEILLGQERAARANRLHHVLRDLAFIEGARAFLRDRLHGRSQRRKLDHVAFVRRGAVEQIMLRVAPGSAASFGSILAQA